MTQVTVLDAQTKLFELVQAALRGEQVLIKETSGAMIQLVPVKQGKRTFGSMKRKIKMSDDFDEPLEEFADYM